MPSPNEIFTKISSLDFDFLYCELSYSTALLNPDPDLSYTQILPKEQNPILPDYSFIIKE